MFCTPCGTSTMWRPILEGLQLQSCDQQKKGIVVVEQLHHFREFMLGAGREVNRADAVAEIGNQEVVMNTRVRLCPQALGMLEEVPCFDRRLQRFPHGVKEPRIGSVRLEYKVYVWNTKPCLNLSIDFQCSPRRIDFAYKWQPAHATQRRDPCVMTHVGAQMSSSELLARIAATLTRLAEQVVLR